MAELGSHQLDACSIFLGKVKPLAVTGVGTRSFFGDVPTTTTGATRAGSTTTSSSPTSSPARTTRGARTAGTDKNDVVVVTYSSISTNGFEPYGECVMGTRGTLVDGQESELMLFKEQEPGKAGKPRDTKVDRQPGRQQAGPGGGEHLGGPARRPRRPAAAATGTGGGPVSRGYREEMEDFAYCIRLWDANVGYSPRRTRDEEEHYIQRLPRCHGEVAMADAILALTANLAMARHQRIEFDPTGSRPTATRCRMRE